VNILENGPVVGGKWSLGKPGEVRVVVTSLAESDSMGLFPGINSRGTCSWSQKFL
jgi:hypothetical protein